MTEIDIADDDALRFIQRVLESNAPYEDRKRAHDMVIAIRTRVRKVYAARPGVKDAITDRQKGEQNHGR